ncbi:hypothetical protein IEO21_04679 [Rhodonia placenta]|uniref:F-box domain-containing protein n=1 Tax=Rhodonia placenta TaxID=104341 RepID=A0A8H7U291_9APHY|nr:hypothetical protein IEO21_04679 [Postia placenta]
MLLSPPLPVELLELIVEHLPQRDIPSVLRANSLFHDISVRVLYREILEMSPLKCVTCLSTLASKPTHARFVHRLQIDWSGHKVIGTLLRLLQRALQQVKSLRHLSLELSSQDNQFNFSWLFSGVQFSLHTLATSARCDGALAEFLETQPLIHELSLRGFQTSMPFILSPSALPRLTSVRSVHAGIPVLEQVIRGRPVEAVSISLFAEDGYAILDTVRSSSRPIKRITVMALDNRQPSKLLLEMSERFPQLEALHVVVLLAFYDHQTLLTFAPFLSRFAHLRYVTFVAGFGARFDEEGEIVKQWHKSCPTLKTIILPKGQVWFERDGKWTCSL